MARQCDITGKKVMSGNNVSHANNKSRRTFAVNLQEASFLSDSLGRPVRLRVSASGIRTVEKSGGLDAFLTSTPNRKLTSTARLIKRQVEKK
ncbi:MAG TPA: 50S ribosomal protein L28 [Holosporales bacterium]|nr:50S ribosomal protein L28 [Holosporales bacterium]HBW24533.1 50S ribosomal protein L28 [Holosporales bacterium]HCC25306.1 50S ribosomal protein L28 [Holosporales bacterium]HCE96182.1 50S ribosomal protein L28 [Holosporales bacterium]